MFDFYAVLVGNDAHKLIFHSIYSGKYIYIYLYINILNYGDILHQELLIMIYNILILFQLFYII